MAKQVTRCVVVVFSASKDEMAGRPMTVEVM
jgi:hypothetical protein